MSPTRIRQQLAREASDAKVWALARRDRGYPHTPDEREIHAIYKAEARRRGIDLRRAMPALGPVADNG